MKISEAPLPPRPPPPSPPLFLPTPPHLDFEKFQFLQYFIEFKNQVPPPPSPSEAGRSRYGMYLFFWRKVYISFEIIEENEILPNEGL